MNRHPSIHPVQSSILVEALEPRIAPAGLLMESKFTAVTVGSPVLLDASGGANDFQGLSTGFGTSAGTYLLYLTAGKALVYTSDLNGDGKFEPGEITGISLGVDSMGRAPNLTLFTDVHGDIVTNLLPGHGVSALTDSDNNPNNGRDGRVLLPTDINGITLRTITAADLDSSIPGNTVDSRLGLTSFSIYGNIYCGGNFNGLSIDQAGVPLLGAKFSGATGIERYVANVPQIGSIITGSAASGQSFHFTQNATNNVEGPFQAFGAAPGQHGGDISNIAAASPSTVYSIGTLQTGDGGGGARGGNISNITLNGVTGSYELIAGDGGAGAVGGQGGSILNFNDLGSLTGQVILHTGAGGTGTLNSGGSGGTATFATTKIAANVEVFLGNGGDGFSAGGAGSGLSNVVLTSPEPTIPIGSEFVGTWHDLGDIGNTHPLYANGALTGYSPEAISFNDPSYFTNPSQAILKGQADRFGDGVFSTNVPGQIEVVFGDGAGGIQDNDGNFNLLSSGTVYLHVPGVVNPVFTVGDFNGDGRPDIAVASNNSANFAGVYVFLNQIGTKLDPITPQNFSRSPFGDHPFSEALQTAVPSFTDFIGSFNGPGAMLGLTTGDYNGDGIADIGVVQEVTIIATPPFPKLAIGVLFGEPAHNAAGQALTNPTTDHFTGLGVTRNAGTGYFYANAAAPGLATLLQFNILDDASDVILKSSSLSAVTNTLIGTGATPNSLARPDIFIYSNLGAGGVITAAAAVDAPTHQIIAPVLAVKKIGGGSVDTNRDLNTPIADNTVSPLVKISVRDYSLQDIDNNGTLDIAFLSLQPLEYLTLSSGDGAGKFTSQSINTQSMFGTHDNDGIYLGKGDITTITAVDTDQNGQFDEFGLLTSSPAGIIVERILLAPIQPGYNIFYPGNGGMNLPPPGSPQYTNQGPLGGVIQPFELTVRGVDAFYINAPVPTNLHPAASYGVISPEQSTATFADLYIFDATGIVQGRYLTENGYFIDAGDGGNSTAGIGGAGGIIGAPTLSFGGTNNTLTGPIDITFPKSTTYAGQVFLLGGAGGSGFGGGGNGGSVEGVVVRYAQGTTVLTSDVILKAGSGGNGLAGNGGNGGGIDHVSVTTGVVFLAGNGGTGANGGTGGNIIGNGLTGGFDTSDGFVGELSADDAAQIGLITPAEALLIDSQTTPPPHLTFSLDGVGLGGGVGGQGSLIGGQGGSITGWDSVFNDVLGGIGGNLYYASGAGGSAAGGVGGSGGAILNSSPDVVQNNLSGVLHLQTGAGGSGLTGGDGGSITTFTNQPTNGSAIPTELYVVAGPGGIGISNTGGTGGSVTGFSSSATGLVSAPNTPLLGIGRVIAGDGGASYGAQGGNGGMVTNVTAQTTSTPIAVAAGAGGAGLTVGGQGGSVSSSVINSAAPFIGKVLIVSGAGGDTSSVLPDGVIIPGDGDTGDVAHVILALGNAAPHGGDGGNIDKIRQPASSQTAVDLIAGNGGSTLNAGTSLGTTGVGKGGSVSEVNLTGTVGAVSRNTTLGVPANPPIQAYVGTDALGNAVTSITGLVDLLALPDSFIFSLNDTGKPTDDFTTISGNVGIVAGQAGLVRGLQPPSDGINGSVQTVTAESIMSIVAGSVAKVAPVNILSGITVTDPDGVLGVDRRPGSPYGPNGRLDYNLPGATPGVTPTVNFLQAGFSLEDADGALFAITIQQTVGTILRGPRVFPVTGG